MKQILVSEDLLRQVLDYVEKGNLGRFADRINVLVKLRNVLEHPACATHTAVEPVWVPIEQKYPQDKEIDILMADGSILCAVLPQSDGDLWWHGAGTGERFIDPKYANVTHWRVHCEVTPPQAQQPAEVPFLTDKEIFEMADDDVFLGNVKEIARAVEAVVRKKAGLK